MCADGSREPKLKSPPSSLVPNTTYDVEEIMAGCEEGEMDQEGSAEKIQCQQEKIRPRHHFQAHMYGRQK
eukprot:5718743-Ditylum_brightwellii.AAC.1